MNTPEHSPESEPSFSAQRWIESTYENRSIDHAIAENFNPFDTLMNAVINARSTEEQLAAECMEDAAVQLKNRFLGLLIELADSDKYHLGDMLGLMDRQAEGMEPTDETRYRQFMGLWDLAVALSRNPDLLEEFKNQY